MLHLIDYVASCKRGQEMKWLASQIATTHDKGAQTNTMAAIRVFEEFLDIFQINFAVHLFHITQCCARIASLDAFGEPPHWSMFVRDRLRVLHANPAPVIKLTSGNRTFWIQECVNEEQATPTAAIKDARTRRDGDDAPLKIKRGVNLMLKSLESSSGFVTTLPSCSVRMSRSAIRYSPI